MAKNLPAGFDQARVLAGLRTAMEFGAPTRAADKATFYLVSSSTDVDTAVDEDDIPFDPAAARRSQVTAKAVSCAIEYVDATDRPTDFGIYQPSRIKITLLDPEYQQVKGFAYVVVGPDRYDYRLTEPPVALGSIDVWTVWAATADEV